MSPKLLVLAVLTTGVLAASGGCDGLPGGVPSQVPTNLPVELPTALPSDLPTQLPTDLPTDLPTALPSLPTGEDTAVPPVVPSDGVAAPTVEAPSGEESVEATAEPGVADDVADAVGGIPTWVWLLLLLLVVGLVVAAIALRRAKAAELAWAALWHDLTGEARWLDERVVPAVQDRSLDPVTLAGRWQDGARRFDDLDRRVWASAGEQTRPPRTADLNALSDALVRLRDALDTEVALRTSGVEQPGLPDAAQTVADARDDLRRTVTDRTR